MDITFTIDDTIAQDFLDRFCTQTGFDPDAGQKQTQWLQQWTIDRWNDQIKNSAQNDALAQAQIVAAQTIDATVKGIIAVDVKGINPIPPIL